MSKGRPPKIRAPQEKKALSYAKDRRNTYGENDKSSRKNIPLRKALAMRADRRGSKQELESVENLNEAAADTLESSLRQDVRRMRPEWRKAPDKPLGEVIAAKHERRAGARGSKAARARELEAAGEDAE